MPDSLINITDTLLLFSDTLPKIQDSCIIALPPQDTLSIVAAPIRFDGTPHPFSLHSQTWVNILMLFQLFVYAYFIFRHGNFWWKRIKALFRSASRIDNSGDLYNKNIWQSWILSFLCSINLAIFLHAAMSEIPQVIENCNLGIENNNLSVLIFLVILPIFFVVKFCLLRFIRFIFFKNEPFIEQYKSDLQTSISVFGMLLYINNLMFIYYASEHQIILLFSGICLYFLFIGVKIYSLLKYFRPQMYSLFHLILYLCTLEILPAALLYITLIELNRQTLTEWITSI